MAVSVIVLNSLTSQPIQGATCTIYDLSCPEPCDWSITFGITDASGIATLFLAPFSYLLSIDKPGYDHIANKPITILTGEDIFTEYMTPGYIPLCTQPNCTLEIL